MAELKELTLDEMHEGLVREILKQDWSSLAETLAQNIAREAGVEYQQVRFDAEEEAHSIVDQRSADCLRLLEAKPGWHFEWFYDDEDPRGDGWLGWAQDGSEDHIAHPGEMQELLTEFDAMDDRSRR